MEKQAARGWVLAVDDGVLLDFLGRDRTICALSFARAGFVERGLWLGASNAYGSAARLLKNLLGAGVHDFVVCSHRCAFLGINNDYVWPVVSGQVAPRAWLEKTLLAYHAQNWINENLPNEAKIAVWGEPRDFYVQRDYFWADDGHNQLIDYQTTRTIGPLCCAN